MQSQPTMILPSMQRGSIQSTTVRHFTDRRAAPEQHRQPYRSSTEETATKDKKRRKK